MSPSDLALCALSVLDMRDVLSEEGARVRSELIATACDSGVEVEDSDCPVVLATLWGLETAFAFSLTPGSRHACGPVQVVPTPRTGTCSELREPVTGLRAGWRVWLKKRLIAGRSVERAFRFYNGHPRNAHRYGERGTRLYKAVMARCAEGGAP